MRKSVWIVVTVFVCSAVPASAQLQSRNRKAADHVKPVPSRPAVKKYPSLLWEISGNGLKRPSYLFGTMHVSDKLAFHLGDSFYNAIKNVDIVALETNPESWQDDFSNSAFYGSGRNAPEPSSIYNRRRNLPNDYMRITTFAIDKYDEAIKASLMVEPSMINGMLYRSYGSQSSDFEEDTFLDMYIFQVGKKLGKRVCGVEDFEESEKLVMEAYRDMLRDQNKKRRSYDYEDMMTNPKKVEEAYRKGDLDMLDSLENLTVFSDAFQEKFLYKRNEIQASSIDSIIKRSSLFVGVGAAHLPGKRGVIEMLRDMGYTLRPVQMDDRNSEQKESIEQIRTTAPFVTQTADDGFYTVAIPGKKFYRFTDWSGMDVVQYADMVNGAYYMVTRIKTNSLIWGHNSEIVYNKIDSLLYENIPGKILKKKPLTKDGYKGLEILNRTRRGDHQRYQVFVTPFEIIVFKVSGTGEYILGGREADRFFESIRFKDYYAENWVNWQPSTGGFTVKLPHKPSVLHDNNYGTDRLEYAAFDKEGNSYLIMRVNLHNYSFIEEDSFDLNLMNESYGYSSFIDKQLKRKFIKINGYPALESKYRHKDGSFSSVKFIIKGPVYYVLSARYTKENERVDRFMNSFAITPYIYPEVKKHVDTTLFFTVQSPVFPTPGKKEQSADELEELLRMAYRDNGEEEEEIPRYGSKLIGNDSVGEKILVTYLRLPKYSSRYDSTRILDLRIGDRRTDSTFIYKVDKRTTLPNGIQSREVHISDTGSSRLIMSKLFYKDGYLFTIATLTDTNSKQSPFISNFFSTFMPADSLKGELLLARKNDMFFRDLFSTDSATAENAREAIYQVKLDSTDVPSIKSAIDKLGWHTSDYLELKNYFINALGDLKDPTVTPYLEKLYWKVNDTSVFQHTILNALLNQRTKASFIAFKDLVLQEPPIIDDDYRYGRSYQPGVVVVGAGTNARNRRRGYRDSRYSGLWYDLYDTLSLSKEIFPDILQLMNIDDYEDRVKDLLVAMVDSGYLKPADYEMYFSKIYLDAKQMLKKQFAREDRERIERASRKDRSPAVDAVSYTEDKDDVLDIGNVELDKYAVLLLPFRDKTPGVQNFFTQLMKTEDRRLLYNSFQLLLRNNLPVPDSLFMKYAVIDSYRSELYNDLEKINKADKFPAQYKNQLDLARSILINSNNRYEKIDTLIYLDKLPVTYDEKKGYVYFFKYRRMRDDMVWQLASVGMLPEKQEDIDLDNDDFTSTRDNRKLENDKPVNEQLQKMLKEMVYSKRKSAVLFYDARSFSLYKKYLSEMVKNRRYRD